MSDSMQCVEFLAGARVEVRDVPVPIPESGEALVKVAISAICGSELSALRGGMWTDSDLNPGHEMAGVVVKANGVRSMVEGQRVGIKVMYGCGQCVYCLQGEPRHCVEGAGTVLGGHSEYIVAPEQISTKSSSSIDAGYRPRI